MWNDVLMCVIGDMTGDFWVCKKEQKSNERDKSL